MKSNIREWLIEDIKNLNSRDVRKLYKYVRRYLVANIEGLIDPLENNRTESKEIEALKKNIETSSGFRASDADIIQSQMKEIDRIARQRDKFKKACEHILLVERGSTFVGNADLLTESLDAVEKIIKEIEIQSLSTNKCQSCDYQNTGECKPTECQGDNNEKITI